MTQLDELLAEMLDWAAGRRSHTNAFMAVECGVEMRVETLRAVAQADLAEVVKLSAAIQALAALGHRPSTAVDRPVDEPTISATPAIGLHRPALVAKNPESVSWLCKHCGVAWPCPPATLAAHRKVTGAPTP